MCRRVLHRTIFVLDILCVELLELRLGVPSRCQELLEYLKKDSVGHIQGCLVQKRTDRTSEWKNGWRNSA